MTALNVPINNGLTPIQENVIAAIAGGATMKAAAEAASIHRNTISYWRRTSAVFCDALGHAQYDKALFIREEAENHLADAFAAVHAILTNPGVSDSARLNAAKYIIEKASTPPPPQPKVIYDVQSEKAEIMHSNAQSPAPDPAQAPPSELQKSEIMHSNAQRPVQSALPQPLRSVPNVGRNEPCPCGSRLKFKRCCLGKAQLTMAA